MKESITWRHFKLLMWKSMMIRKRDRWYFLLELLFPIALFLAYPLVIQHYHIFNNGTDAKNRQTRKIDLRELNSNFDSSTKLCYYPTVDFTKEIMRKVQSKLKLEAENVLDFRNKSNFLNYCLKTHENNSIFAITFQILNGSAVPQDFDYFIKPYIKDINRNKATLVDNKDSRKDIKTSLLNLQIALEASFVETLTNNSLPFNIAVHEFTHSQRSAYSQIPIFFNLVFPVLIFIGFLLTLDLALGEPAIEKGSGIKELMKTSGLDSWLIYLGWIFHHITVNIITILISVKILTVPIWKANEALIKYSSFSVMVIILFLFCFSIITFGLFVSSGFDNEVTARNVGAGVWLITMLFDTKDITNKSIRMLLSILPQYAVGFICQELGVYELEKTGANWSNISKSANGDINALTISNGLSMMCVSCVVFSILSLYIEQVFPGRYGASKPFYFFIHYINKCWKKVLQPNQVESETSFVVNLGNTEPPAPTLKLGIGIKQLCKSYGSITAIDNLSLDIYTGLITVLLGQNGAGKTTIMSIITGMVKATSGKVFINGKDIRYNMDLIRCSLGYCPQNNINFEALNVLDHFIFFGMLKGHNKPEATSQAMVVLNELNLYEQREKQAKDLSGGMQRRLSLGIALMGNSKVLILDEPTSGLDPETRRELWDILLKLKKSRTVIITTHFLEEADALADRIAIIDHGQLKCYGSPMFLKKLYGSGYHLTLIRDKNLFEERYPGGNQVDTITKLVQGKLKEATLFDSNFNFLVFALPYDKKSQYSVLLSEIESTKQALCVTHIELSITTLEEVFLKAASFRLNDNQELKSSLQCSALQDNKKIKSINLQLRTLVQKRWLILKRRYLIYLIPALFAMILCVGIVHLTYKSGTAKTISQKSVNNYERTSVYYSTNNNTNYFTNIKKRHATLIEEQHNATYSIDKLDNIDKFTIVAEKSNDSGLSVHLLGNSIWKTLTNKNYSITSIISPLRDDKFRFKSEGKMENKMTTILIYWVLLYPCGLMFLVLPFMILPQMETVSNLKQLQLMCGVHPLQYWCVFYIMDLSFYLIWVLIMGTIMLTYQFYGLPFFDQISFCYMLMAILVAYGMPVIPFTYLFSNAKSALDAIMWYFYIAMFVPLALLFWVVTKALPSWSNYLLVLYPQYGLMNALLMFGINGMTANEVFTLEQCKTVKHPCCDQVNTQACNEAFIDQSNEDKIKLIYYLLIMITSTCLYFAILMIMEEQFIQNLFEKIRLMMYRLLMCNEEPTSGNDFTNREDVKLVQEKISEIMNRELNQRDDILADNSQTVLITHNLEKSFKGVKVVKQISFSVDAGECFGLLGVNGAGKTTTFRMLTGNLAVLVGECRIASPSGQKLYLSKTPKQYFSNIGYCPQYDIIDEILTGYEMLTLFGKLRGISEGLDKEIKIYAKSLGFDEIINRACGSYSGGNKRKLSIAMALIGVPTVILLDEPTSGVDPISRRAMWNMVKLMQTQKIKPAMVLTTHSMEECEVLCNKVAIMKAGEFQCYGTIPQLKTKYAQGFTVTLKLLAGDNAAQQLTKVQNLKLKFQQMYKGTCKLKDEYASLLQYHISDVNKKWSDIFKDMEQLQKEFANIIEDYIVTETTLEEVFITIARPE